MFFRRLFGRGRKPRTPTFAPPVEPGDHAGQAVAERAVLSWIPYLTDRGLARVRDAASDELAQRRRGRSGL